MFFLSFGNLRLVFSRVSYKRAYCAVNLRIHVLLCRALGREQSQQREGDAGADRDRRAEAGKLRRVSGVSGSVSADGVSYHHHMRTRVSLAVRRALAGTKRQLSML